MAVKLEQRQVIRNDQKRQCLRFWRQWINLSAFARDFGHRQLSAIAAVTTGRLPAVQMALSKSCCAVRNQIPSKAAAF